MLVGGGDHLVVAHRAARLHDRGDAGLGRGIDVLAEAGAACVVQPGGSVRDDEVIAAADEHGLAMLLTGMRHFRH